MSHIGIELRISIPAGVIMQADSDRLHLQAKLSRPNGEGWAEVLKTVDGLVIESRAVELPDKYQDYEDYEDDEDDEDD